MGLGSKAPACGRYLCRSPLRQLQRLVGRQSTLDRPEPTGSSGELQGPLRPVGGVAKTPPLPLLFVLGPRETYLNARKLAHLSGTCPI